MAKKTNNQNIRILGNVRNSIINTGAMIINLFIGDNLPFLSTMQKKLRFVSIIVVLILFLVSYRVIIGTIDMQNTKMSGDFRIAIAEFKVIGNKNAKDFAFEIPNALQIKLQDLLAKDKIISYSVWGPTQTGVTKGITDEERTQWAADLADKISADIIVYGIIDATDSDWQVKPQFYIASQNFYEAYELTGQYEFGAKFSLRGFNQTAVRLSAAEIMAPRTEYFSLISQALAYYAIEDYSKSITIYKDLLTKLEYDNDKNILKVIYLLYGNAALKKGDLTEAKIMYQNSINLDPEYSRPYIGMASVYYLDGVSLYQETQKLEDVDIDSINKALLLYEQAALSENRPIYSDITEKTVFGKGQCFLIFALVDGGNLGIPFNSFQKVADEYSRTNRVSLLELAAESHARMGLIYRLRGDIKKAYSEYEFAVKLLDHYPSRQALFEQVMEDLE